MVLLREEEEGNGINEEGTMTTPLEGEGEGDRNMDDHPMRDLNGPINRENKRSCQPNRPMLLILATCPLISTKKKSVNSLNKIIVRLIL